MPQKIVLITRPTTNFEVPVSEGYQLYSAILKLIGENDKVISKHAHDSAISSISISALNGKFKKGNRPNHKVLGSLEKYQFNIGITDPNEIEIFQAIIKSLIFEENNIILDKGELRIEDVTSSPVISFEKIVSSVEGEPNQHIRFQFKTPTCIQYKNSKVFEMFPHREAVFTSLLSKWNAVCPVEMKMSIERDELARYIIEKPDVPSYDTHSVMVNTVFDKVKRHHRPILRQGFIGNCTYQITKNAPHDVRNAVMVLSRFANYSGVGSAVSRGCGWVEVEVDEVKK